MDGRDGHGVGLRLDGACLYVHCDVVVCRRAFPGEGPAAQGPRARRNWPSPRASSSALRTMLLPSPSPLRFEEDDPGEGSDAAQSGVRDR